METKFIEINGIKTEYAYKKINDPCIVFVHGVGGNLQQFIKQFELFDEYSVLALSLPGHGNSAMEKNPSKSSFSVNNLARHISKLIKELNIEKYYLVGNSAGGIIGYELVSMDRGKIRSLVTYGTTAKLSLSQAMISLVVSIDRFMIRFLPNTYLKLLARSVSKSEKVQDKVFSMFTQAKKAIPLLRANIGKYDYLKIVENINIPYLLIKASDDKEINKTLEETLETIKISDLGFIETLDNAGHVANLDNPEDFSNILRSFFKSI